MYIMDVVVDMSDKEIEFVINREAVKTPSA